MNVYGGTWVEIPVTHDGDGLHGTIRALHDAGYYATVVGNTGDIAILYGPRREHLSNRVPYLALVGDTIRVTDRSAEQHHQDSDRQ